MVQSFKKDIFSKSKIRWTSNINKEDLYKIKIIVKNNIISSKLSIKQNGGMEINSNNFKLISKSKKFILKRWSKKMKISEIYKIIEIINWLNKKKIKTPIIQKFKNNKKVIKYEKEYWSYFNYIEGNHFKGKLKEMKNVASYLGSFLNELKRYSFTKNKREYKYYTKDDENIFLLKKKFIFENFLKSQEFVSNVGKISEQEGHHPDITFGWGYAEIKILTHAIKGLSENDFILAAKIDQIINV